MNRSAGLLLIVLLLFFTSGCFSHLALYDGPYRGRIIDDDTREPIEGVVVLGTWYKSIPTAAGSVSRFYDARESVTDENGEFYFGGKGPRAMSNLEPVYLYVFKTGYEFFKARWDSLDYDDMLKQIVEWEGSKPIIPLRKLTMEQRKRLGGPRRPDTKAKLENIIHYLKEIDKERIAIGVEPFRTWRGKEYD